MGNALSGYQHEIAAHGYAATIASIGASLRSLTYEGRDLVVPFEADEVRPAYRGVTLAPWPNRVVDGRYHFGGVEQQLPLTEPARGHALHGLAAWLDFEPVLRESARVVLAATIEAQTGYPHRILVEVEFRLDESGLHTNVTATNTGPDAAPFGTGPHPYLVAGAGSVDDWALELPAEVVLEVTPDRLVPTGATPVAEARDGDSFDYRMPRRIGSTEIDHAFTGLAFGEDGLVRARLTDTDGRGVGMSWAADCPWVQIHTADGSGRSGLAVEPMTCPPDAFNSGTDLIVLEPGAAASAGWTIFAI
ncbi:aldose 1-epimerase family protein [Agromyces salentinus]|uniref:Aldose 1-epimerase family protein n=1 Tax=Agromyces salentinus TaxID=269421 RepID=A0ABN2MG72_9MICO|nr:aldose 1-epimerase family protein [Agromyces salentinus]